jgi:hypothetical protein
VLEEAGLTDVDGAIDAMAGRGIRPHQAMACVIDWRRECDARPDHLQPLGPGLLYRRLLTLQPGQSSDTVGDERRTSAEQSMQRELAQAAKSLLRDAQRRRDVGDPKAPDLESLAQLLPEHERQLWRRDGLTSDRAALALARLLTAQQSQEVAT